MNIQNLEIAQSFFYSSHFNFIIAKILLSWLWSLLL